MSEVARVTVAESTRLHSGGLLIVHPEAECGGFELDSPAYVEGRRYLAGVVTALHGPSGCLTLDAPEGPALEVGDVLVSVLPEETSA